MMMRPKIDRTLTGWRAEPWTCADGRVIGWRVVRGPRDAMEFEAHGRFFASQRQTVAECEQWVKERIEELRAFGCMVA